jgi:hypothetical protein
MGWVANAMPRLFYPPQNDTVPIVKQAGWDSELILWRNSHGNHSVEDLAGHRISLDTVQK